MDWWSFGILVFEMAAGYSPFYAGNSDQMVLLEKIVAGKYKCPSAFSSELKNLVQNILQADLTRRYNYRLELSQTFNNILLFEDMEI